MSRVRGVFSKNPVDLFACPSGIGRIRALGRGQLRVRRIHEDELQYRPGFKPETNK